MKALLFVLMLVVPAISYADGFTVQVEQNSRPYTITSDGRLTTDTQYGLVVKFCSDDQQTVAFAGEVSYRLEGSKIVDHMNVTAWPNFNKCGVAFLWVGKTVESKAVGWEVTAIGRRSESPEPQN